MAEQKAKQAVHESQSSGSAAVHEVTINVEAQKAAIRQQAEELHNAEVARLVAKTQADQEARDKIWLEKEASNLQLFREEMQKVAMQQQQKSLHSANMQRELEELRSQAREQIALRDQKIAEVAEKAKTDLAAAEKKKQLWMMTYGSSSFRSKRRPTSTCALASRTPNRIRIGTEPSEMMRDPCRPVH